MAIVNQKQEITMSIFQNNGLIQILKKSQGHLKALFLLSLLFIISSCGGGSSDGDPTPPTNVNPLTSLSVSNVNLSPSFSTTVSSYTATVSFSTSSITLQASVISGASVTVNSAAFNGSGSFDLTVGSNVFSIVVTNNGASETYTVTITREAASTDVALSDLAISSGSLSPVFTSQTLTYGVSVDNETSSITVTPTSSDSNASIVVNGSAVTSGSASGAIDLTVGDNAIELVVTAEDGTSTQTYIVTVSRLAPLSDDADLSSLSLSIGSLDPSFDAATLTYSASVNFTTTSITATPILSDTAASVTVNGTLTDSGAASASINLDEGENTITLVVLAEDDTTTQTYTVTVTRQAAAAFAQQAYIKASNTERFDSFGDSVALNGDTLAVGVQFEESNSTGVGGDETNNDADQSGAVYVFTRTANVWTQQAYIKASNTDADDNFGISVALDGDTLAVGAWLEDSNATDIDGDEDNNAANASGAVYVFIRNGSTWSQQAYIKADTIITSGTIGASVALSGDTLAVGSTGQGPGVYVFTRSGGTWTQQAIVQGSNTDGFDRFGNSVSLDGDTLAVGAFSEDSNSTGIGQDETNDNATRSGAVYVFTRNGVAWSQQAYIKASNTELEDFFGWSVALSGDTLAVGAPQEDSNATGVGGDETNNDVGRAGAVYVFARSSNTWTQQAYIKASNTDAGAENFGWSVALDGNTLAVGAAFEQSNSTGIGGDETNNDASGSGAVYLFTRSGSTWSQQAYVKASNTESGDVFGRSVALDGDILAVGAPLEDSNSIGIGQDEGNNDTSDSGAVYVFEIPPSGNAN